MTWRVQNNKEKQICLCKAKINPYLEFIKTLKKVIFKTLKITIE